MYQQTPEGSSVFSRALLAWFLQSQAQKIAKEEKAAKQVAGLLFLGLNMHKHDLAGSEAM